MATIVLQAAGAFLGGIFGPIGSAIGSAAGAMAGYAIDQTLLQGHRRIEGPRLGAPKPFLAEEGQPIPRVYGTMRIGGNLIWATRFHETKTVERQGAKAGPKVTTTTYAYSGNFAFALCEGPIAGVRRIWADGRELDLEGINLRIYTGSEDQQADPLIDAKLVHGTPTYRGTAYAVFDHFALGDFGNRIPQFQFEVLRPVGELHRHIRSVALLPGATEYGLDPEQVTFTPSPGVTIHVNRNVLHGSSDLLASLDELQALCLNLEEVAVVVSWFGNDLRAAQCQIRPMVTQNASLDFSEEWRVSGVVREEAQTVSYVEGVAAYGGTPSDLSVVRCIQEIRRRGLRVALYPFLMMDVPPSNGLPDPYGEDEQSAFPWRGRISCFPAPNAPGSPDKSSAIRTDVSSFCGSANSASFALDESGVTYLGDPEDWGYRRLVLHYAWLASQAGGVDTFLIGSELRGLTSLRDGSSHFPFVEALCQLASEVRSILGSETKITYGADWSEYFGHQPADGSGDVFFHLDELWAHPAIDAVGIDNYMPLADWRDEDLNGRNPDGFLLPYDINGLRSQICAGEGFDWFYASSEARQIRSRTPITDGAYGKPWVFRYKDLVSWWENEHFNRIGGVEMAEPTAWRPQSKPIWFTEIGCPAVDKGPNQPNVFPDSKSSENAVPYFSSGARADDAPARFLAAHFQHWDPASAYFDEANNPVSTIYGGRMLDISRSCVWAWDARPFPAFPLHTKIWADGENWSAGHWLNGRLCGVRTSDLISAILSDHSLPAAETRDVAGSLNGYLTDAPETARAALEPLAQLFGILAAERDGTLHFSAENLARSILTIDDIVLDEAITFERSRTQLRDLPEAAEVTFVDSFSEYQTAVARVIRPGAHAAEIERLSLPGSIHREGAETQIREWLERRHVARDTIGFALPADALGIEVGAVISLSSDSAGYDYLVTEVEQGLSRKLSARRISRRAATAKPAELGEPSFRPPVIAGAPHVVMLDLPLMPGSHGVESSYRIAAFAEPWRRQAVYASPEQTGFQLTAVIESRATIGSLVEPLTPGPEGRVDLSGRAKVRLFGGELASASTASLHNGANVAAIGSTEGGWELLQFSNAQEVEANVWQLSSLLRAQLGTNDVMMRGHPAGATFVLVNGSVVSSGLPAALSGFSLNWRVGPAGLAFGTRKFHQAQATGGVRARLPFSPVHLRAKRQSNGDVLFSWIRRGRIDADSWIGEDIPLGEEFEKYRIECTDMEDNIRRVAETSSPSWTYSNGMQLEDFPLQPSEIKVTVRQISATVGAGVAARCSTILP